MKMKNLFGFLVLFAFSFSFSEGLGAKKDYWNQFPIKKGRDRSFEINGLEGLDILVIPSLSKNKTKSIVWKTPGPMTADLLWFILDWVGEGSDWLEIDFKAKIDSQLSRALKSKDGNGDLAWVLRKNNEVVAVAKLINTLNGSQKLFVNSVTLSKAKYTTPKFIYNDPTYTFFNYKIVGSEMCLLKIEPQCSYVHLDNPDLSVKINGDDINFEYQKPDEKKIMAFDDFDNANQMQQKHMVDDWIKFFHYEYSIMARAFINSSRGIFDWQAWQWMDNWEKGFITREEITSFLKAGEIPSSVVVYRLKTTSKEVTMSCDLNGRYYMTIESLK